MTAIKIDWYSKAALTGIAVLLGVIAARPYVGPEVVQAQGAFSGVQYGPTSQSQNFFDARTGDLWGYLGDRVLYRGNVTKLGQPIVTEK